MQARRIGAIGDIERVAVHREHVGVRLLGSPRANDNALHGPMPKADINVPQKRIREWVEIQRNRCVVNVRPTAYANRVGVVSEEG